MRHGMKLKSSVLFLALMAGMWGCSDSDDLGEEKAKKVTTFEELQEACQIGGSAIEPKRVALEADIVFPKSDGWRPIAGAGAFEIEGNGHTFTYHVGESDFTYFLGVMDGQNITCDIVFNNLNFDLENAHFFLQAANGSTFVFNDVEIKIGRSEGISDSDYITGNYLWSDGWNSCVELNEGTTIEKADGSGSVLSVQDGGKLVFDGGRISEDDFMRFAQNGEKNDYPAIVLRRALDFHLTVLFTSSFLSGDEEVLLVRGENYTLTEADFSQFSLHPGSAVWLDGNNIQAVRVNEYYELYLNEEENAIKLRRIK